MIWRSSRRSRPGYRHRFGRRLLQPLPVCLLAFVCLAVGAASTTPAGLTTGFMLAIGILAGHFLGAVQGIAVRLSRLVRPLAWHCHGHGCARCACRSLVCPVCLAVGDALPIPFGWHSSWSSTTTWSPASDSALLRRSRAAALAAGRCWLLLPPRCCAAALLVAVALAAGLLLLPLTVCDL